MCNQCQSPLKLWVRIPLMMKSIRYNIMIKLVSDFRQVSGFLGYSGFLHQYNWDIAQSGVKHHNPNSLAIIITVIVTVKPALVSSNCYNVTLFLFLFIVHLISIKHVFSDQLIYVTIFHSSLIRSHKKGLAVQCLFQFVSHIRRLLYFWIESKNSECKSADIAAPSGCVDSHNWLK